MKQYSAKSYDLKSDDQERDAGPFWVRVYLASEVDAARALEEGVQMELRKRIEELESLRIESARNDRILELEKALRWMVENEVWWDFSRKHFTEYMGQGECQHLQGDDDVRRTLLGL